MTSGNKALPETPPAAVLAAYGCDEESLRAVASGWINRTWLVERPPAETLVLQAVNPIFSAESIHDIDAVTRHLAAHGYTTTRVITARDGRLFRRQDGVIWRALTYIDGQPLERIERAEQARDAGAVLGSLHVGLAGFTAPLRKLRSGVHVLSRHLEALATALSQHRAHPAHRPVERLAAELEALRARLPPLRAHPNRLVHGDPKLSNLLFDRRTGRALCLIDWDTLGSMPVAYELGDALRSWCNPAGEDAADASFAEPLFAEAVAGYAGAAGELLDPVEVRDIAAATATIAVELAARFLADALNEAYFRWDSLRFESAAEHNQARTRAQLRVAADVIAAKPRLDKLAAIAFGLHRLA